MQNNIHDPFPPPLQYNPIELQPQPASYAGITNRPTKNTPTLTSPKHERMPHIEGNEHVSPTPCTTEELKSQSRDEWIRDLTAENIEPNPGPIEHSPNQDGTPNKYGTTPHAENIAH